MDNNTKSDFTIKDKAVLIAEVAVETAINLQPLFKCMK